MVGSIGVISMAAAYKNALDKNLIGVSEVTTSPKLLEARFDPTARNDVSEELVETIKSMQAEIFVSFRDHVNKHRADKFDQTKLDQIFSADVVLGEEAKALGLADEIGDFETVIKEKHPDLKVKDFSQVSKFEKIAESLSNAASIQIRN